MTVGRLVDLDMAFLGPRVIIAEFAAGVAGCLALGMLSLTHAARAHAGVTSWSVVIGLELVAVGINYVPLLAEAVRRRKDEVGRAATKAAIRHDPTEARSYGLRQAWILIPGAVVVFALVGRRPDISGDLAPVGHHGQRSGDEEDAGAPGERDPDFASDRLLRE